MNLRTVIARIVVTSKSTARFRQASAVCAIVLMLLVFSSLPARSAALGSLRAVFLDVGQGDSMLLRDANGFNVLIDGGETYAGPTVVAYLREQISQHGLEDIDVLVVSHPDSDHLGGLIDVLQATDIPIRSVVYSGYPANTDIWNQFLSEVAKRSLTPIVAQFPGVFTWGEMTAHVLNPPAGLANPESNDASVVLRVDHGAVNFLFTGDIDSGVESQVIARGTPLAAEVLKVAHHGSGSSSNAAFLSAVGAREAVIPVGADNDYNHPSPETLQRLYAAGAKIWRTDQHGNVYVVSDGTNYTITADTLWRIFLPAVQRLDGSVVPPTQNVIVKTIFYDGVLANEPDEYVEIQNIDAQAINLQSWTLRDNASTPNTYTFPAFTIQPNQVCRVYTNENHPESCGFSYGRRQGIWNNTGGDCAILSNAQGQEVNRKCY